MTGRSMAINSGFDIEQTGYYLSGIKKTQADIDLLMLIKGSGFLSWNNFVRNSFKSVEYPAEQALSISGNVKGKSGLPYRNKDVFMFVINSGNLLSTKTDSQGRFQFKHLVFTDGTRFLLSTSGSANRAAGEKIILDEDELWPTGGGQSTRFTEDSVKLPGTYSRKLGNSKINEVAYVNGIIAADRRKLSSSDQNRTSNADQVIRGEEINNAPNLSSALTGMLRGVDFVRKRGVPYLQGVNEPITIIVDGTILNGAGINQLNPNSIALIELYKGANAGIYNANAGGGTLVITTKSLENGLQSNSMSSGALQIQPKGFYNPRNFKSAIYSEQQAKENGNDTSATVYWNPELVTDKNGNASFSFYTPNIAGNYRIEIEGIDKKGNSGRQVYYFKVE